MTLDATLSGEFANSYVTRAYADTYFSSHYVADKTALWATFSNDQKDLLLIHATIYGIENFPFVSQDGSRNLYHYKFNRNSGTIVPYVDGDYIPFKYDLNQNLQFPRNLDISTTGTVYIPEDVKVAQCEQAIYIANQDEETLQNFSNGLKSESVTIGPIKTSQEYVITGSGGTSVSPIVKQLLEKYLFSRNRVYRG